MARHCSKCELPCVICACAEAAAYDKANPLRVDPKELGFDEEPGTSIGRDGFKKSHRGEGSNFVD